MKELTKAVEQERKWLRAATDATSRADTRQTHARKCRDTSLARGRAGWAHLLAADKFFDHDLFPLAIERAGVMDPWDCIAEYTIDDLNAEGGDGHESNAGSNTDELWSPRNAQTSVLF